MATKERQLDIFNVTKATPIDQLKVLLGTYGELQNCFLMQTGQWIKATYKSVSNAQAACEALDGYFFDGKRLRVSLASNKPKKSGKSQNVTSSTTASFSALTEEDERPNDPRPLAPAPRLLEPSSTATRTASNQLDPSDPTLNRPRDTWEISLEDSDYDDGFVPYVPNNKPKPVTIHEWNEAFDLLKSFAHLGGAILAVDVESWDQDHDYIIEVGLAHVQYEAGRGNPPLVKAEHIIIIENDAKVNGTYSANARERFAFGKSKKMSELETTMRLRFLITKYSKKQPLVLLFHNASAEKQYFALLDVSLDDCAEAIPRKLLGFNREARGTGVGPRADRSAKIILDTQRLYKAFVLNENEKNPKLGLANICRKLGIHTKHLHNAGNDALYTLKVLMKLAEKQMERDKLLKVKIQDPDDTF